MSKLQKKKKRRLLNFQSYCPADSHATLDRRITTPGPTFQSFQNLDKTGVKG